MQFSILIVSYNRKADLQKSLAILETQIDIMVTEVLVYLDGCNDGSQELKKNFSWVHWIICPTCLGASAARAKLYPMAKGEILIGLDDDAHFISKNYFENIKNIFAQQPNTALIAFEEVKGVFQSDKIALQHSSKEYKQYQCTDFIGCGFAVRKSMYKLTNGFPIWVDIYGEESCLSLEILDKGFDIVFDNSIKVNHRVDIAKRKSEGKNYFRFGKQLKNITYYYLVYYKKPLFPILKLYFHNFKKYTLTDFRCFKIFIKVIFQVFFNFPKVLKFRKPIQKKTILKLKKLSGLQY